MANTTNFGWETPDDTDLVKDGAAAMRTLGNSIDTSLVDLKGGTTGQVLSKASNTDLDFSWVAQDDSNAIQNAIVDAKGDLISATAADTPARLAVGTNGQVLTADSAQSTGLKWATPDSGKIKQVVTGTLKTTLTGSSTTFADTGLSVTITPTSNTSTILINAVLPLGLSSGAWAAFLTLTDGSNNILIDPTSSGNRTKSFVRYEYGNQYTMEPQSLVFLHSPATTSAVTYKVRYRVTSASAVATINRAAQDADSDAYGQGISTINVMEIGA